MAPFSLSCLKAPFFFQAGSSPIDPNTQKCGNVDGLEVGSEQQIKSLTPDRASSSGGLTLEASGEDGATKRVVLLGWGRNCLELHVLKRFEIKEKP